MKRVNLFMISLTLPIILTTFGCSGNKKEKKPTQTAEQTEITVKSHEVKNPVIVGTETSLLLKDLVDNGDYVNTKDFPSLIKASIVQESLDKNILVIDLRSPRLFSEGHIKGAVNKKFDELPAYFETGIKPFKCDKIIMVSEDGQVSSYAASLLRLMGYGNVFSMRWGMSAWNLKYANEGWLKDVSGKYEANLENITNEKPASKDMPDLKTGKATGPGNRRCQIPSAF